MPRHFQSQVEWFGASVKGPLHQREGRPNEDAWLGSSGAFGTVIVVADGMGSRLNARIGARMACQAVKDALPHWARAEGADPTMLLRLVHLLWGLRILPACGEDSATTCLFAAVVPSGELILAKLGDGILAVRTADGKVDVLGSEREGFSNQTTGLGVARSITEWSILIKPCLLPGASVLLASDGIADDLLRESLGDLICFLTKHFGQMEPAARWRALCRELRAWPTPRHLDDKTLAVLWHRDGDL